MRDFRTVVAALAAAVLGAAFWLGRPLWPGAGEVRLPAVTVESPTAALSPLRPAAPLGISELQLGAAACALAAGSIATILAEGGAGFAPVLAVGGAAAVLPASGSPAGALSLFAWLLLAGLRRRPARWRAAGAGVAIAVTSLFDISGLLLLPVAWFHIRHAYPRGGRLEPTALAGGFAVGGWVFLSAVALLARSSFAAVPARLARLTALSPGRFGQRLYEAAFPAGPVGALLEGRLDVAGAVSLVAITVAVAVLAAGLWGLVSGRNTVLPPRRPAAYAASCAVVLFGVLAVVAPARTPAPWIVCFGGLLWLWGIGTGGLTARVRSAVLVALPVSLALAQAATLLR